MYVFGGVYIDLDYVALKPFGSFDCLIHLLMTLSSLHRLIPRCMLQIRSWRPDTLGTIFGPGASMQWRCEAQKFSVATSANTSRCLARPDPSCWMQSIVQLSNGTLQTYQSDLFWWFHVTFAIWIVNIMLPRKCTWSKLSKAPRGFLGTHACSHFVFVIFFGLQSCLPQHLSLYFGGCLNLNRSRNLNLNLKPKP